MTVATDLAGAGVAALLRELGLDEVARLTPSIMDILAARVGPAVLRAHVNRIELEVALVESAADAAELAKFGPER